MPRHPAQDTSGISTEASRLSVHFWGVRGTAPVFGEPFQTFGGHTMCLEICSGNHRVVIDAGTGLRQLGLMLSQNRPSSTDILLTHYHLDHLMGLMTFAPLFQRGSTVTVHAPILDTRDPKVFLQEFLNTPFAPMAAREAGSTFSIRSFHPGETLQLADLTVRTARLLHPGGACGYRVEDTKRSVAIVVDHEHASMTPDPALVALCSAADLVLYDSHWDEDVDYHLHQGWGHSTWQAGLRLIKAAGALRLGGVHHSPDATDTTLLDRQKRLSEAHSASFLAREGVRIIV